MDSKLEANLSNVFSELAIEVSAILSYHISEKETPRPLLILLKCGHDLVGVRGVNRRVDGEVGLHGLDPSYGIRGFS